MFTNQVQDAMCNTHLTVCWHNI